MNRVIKVGSRESALAVAQAEILIDSIKKGNPSFDFELVKIKTKGDKILDQSLDKIGGKGLFIKELEDALYKEKIDIAVHSYKDMPYEETDGLPIVALSDREAPFDALVLPMNPTEIDKTKPVGSSSLRRSIQYMAYDEGSIISPIRGNVLTRISKLDNGEYSAIILAQAGLNRLNLQNRISKVFSVEEMIPSASQGILAVQGRSGEDYSYLSCFHSKESEYASKAERQFLKTLGGDCSSPTAAYAEINGSEIKLIGMFADDSNQMTKDYICGSLDEARELGEKLAIRLMNGTVKKW